MLEGDILLSLGDFVYNLRSGLDQLAWQLCLSAGGDPGRDTMFPIYEKEDAKSEELFQKRVKGMPPTLSLSSGNFSRTSAAHPTDSIRCGN